MSDSTPFRLLSDQPVGDGRQEDLLGRFDPARQLADLIRDSRDAAPFTLCVYAGWGMGKSSLLRQVAAKLKESDEVETVWFNAWTASRSDALEALIKSVLDRLGTGALRRMARRLRRDQRMAAWTRAAVYGLAGAARLHHLVDEIWNQMTIDAKARNEAREALRATLSTWADGEGKHLRQRMIVVFVDDLDRCPPEVIRTVCDAIKQYLNIPGMAFILGCDRNAVENAVTDGMGHAPGSVGRRYLEKIVQVSYSIPVPTDIDARTLVEGFARQSGTLDLFRGAVRDVVIEHTGRNPRRIKRLINRFIVEYRLDPTWAKSDPGALIRVILLQDFYPDFFDLLIFKDIDPIDEFIDYLAIRALEATSLTSDPDTRELVGRFLREHRLPAQLIDAAREELIERIEAELPADYGPLVVDRTFVGLISEFAGSSTDRELRAKLRGQGFSRSPLLAASDRPSEYDSLPTSRVLDMIAQAQHTIRILDTSSILMAEAGSQFTRAAEAAMARGVKVQVLLLAPTTQAAQDRAAEIQDPTFDTRIEDNIRELRRLALKMTKAGVDGELLEVRLYNRLPECSVHQVDDKVIVAFLPYQRRTSRVRHLEIGQDASLGQFAALQFDAKWETARPLDGMRYADVRTATGTKHLLLRIWDVQETRYLASHRIEGILAENASTRVSRAPELHIVVEDQPGGQFTLSQPLALDSTDGRSAADAFAEIFGVAPDAPIRRLELRAAATS